jgi:hypothetical protein
VVELFGQTRHKAEQRSWEPVPGEKQPNTQAEKYLKITLFSGEITGTGLRFRTALTGKVEFAREKASRSTLTNSTELALRVSQG